MTGGATPPRRRLADFGIAWMRTVLPGIWSAAVTLAVARGLLPDAWTPWATTVGTTVIFPAVLAVLYPALRWLEARLPAVVMAVFLGAPKVTPTYPGPDTGPVPYPIH